MRNFKLALLAGLSLLASSCSLTSQLRPHRAAPAAQLASLLSEHPELVAKPETVKVKVFYRVPEIHFEKELVPVYDTVYITRERGQLDSLVNQLQSRLDSVQVVAVRHQLHQLLSGRPVLRDTLRFDTLGVSGKIWRVGQHYKINLVRRALQGSTTGPALVPRLREALPPRYPFYNPAGWPLSWWAWLLIGLLLGLLLPRRR
jgi:hypothetical protein